MPSNLVVLPFCLCVDREACVCFGEAVRLLSQSESLTCVQKDALATAYLSLALCLYEKCGRQSSSSTTELEDKSKCPVCL